MKLKPTQTILLLFFGIILLATTGWTIINEIDQPWKTFQNEFKSVEKKLLLEKKNRVEIQKKGASVQELKKLNLRERQLDQQLKVNSRRSAKIEQIWIADLKRADRCLTCHGGMEKGIFEPVKGPFGKHPGNFLKTHPTKAFGCTLCHDGDGMGLTAETGHGEPAHGEAAHWNRPLLRGELVESSCRRCHPYNDLVPEHVTFPQAPVLSRGKNLYVSKGCRGCHELIDFKRPESIAPVLSRVGEKVSAKWLEKWLKRPKDYLPETIMPFFDLPSEEIGALSAFLLTKKEKTQDAGKVLETWDISNGKKLVNKIGCLGCHKVGKTGGTFGPDLSRVAEKLDSLWQIPWIQNPQAYDPQTVMPDFRLLENEINDISGYLLTLGKKEAIVEQADKSIAAPKTIKKGKKLFAQRGCTGCHTMEEFALGFKKAPEHTGFGDKRVDELDFGNVTDIPRTRAAWVLAKEKSPRVFTTETIKLIMPNFDLSDDEAKALRTFVLSFTKLTLPSEYNKTLWNTDDPFLAGMRTVETFNCIGCHKIGLTKKAVKLTEDIVDSYFWAASNLTLEDIKTKGKTAYEKGRELTDSQFAALIKEDPAAEKLLFRNRWFLDIDTVDYLNLDMGFKTVNTSGMDEGEILSNYKDLNFAPPLLHYEGIKVEANWMFQFLKAPYPIRPLTKATMPTFNLKQKEIKDLVEFFQVRDGIGHNPFFATPEVEHSETETAEKIFKVCLQCHYFDQKRTENKERFGGLKGPNLAEVKRRLRPEYIKNWIKYPELIVPGTQMKNFFYYFDIYERFEKLEKDETGFPEISPDEKIDLMARFLMNPLKSANLKGSRAGE